MKIIFSLVLWALSLVYTERVYMLQSALIDTAERMANALRAGICESRMSLGEILCGIDFPSHQRYGSFSSFIEENKDVLDISDDTLSSVKLFEEQSAYLSVKECEKLITDMCEEISAHLLRSRAELKNRLAGMRTVVSAFFLILVILLV